LARAPGRAPATHNHSRSVPFAPASAPQGPIESDRSRRSRFRAAQGKSASNRQSKRQLLAYWSYRLPDPCPQIASICCRAILAGECVARRVVADCDSRHKLTAAAEGAAAFRTSSVHLVWSLWLTGNTRRPATSTRTRSPRSDQSRTDSYRPASVGGLLAGPS
jgi:hypothetical protein